MSKDGGINHNLVCPQVQHHVRIPAVASHHKYNAEEPFGHFASPYTEPTQALTALKIGV